MILQPVKYRFRKGAGGLLILDTMTNIIVKARLADWE